MRERALVMVIGLATLAWPAVAAPAGDEAVRSLLARGNDAAARGDWDIAESTYREAASVDSTRADTLYNLARALHGMERIEEAERAYAEALRVSGDRPDIAGRALFNLGDLAARRASAMEAENPRGAIDALREASARYRDARRLLPDERDAARNVEAVNRRIQALRDRVAQEQAMREALEKLAQDLEDLAEEAEQNQTPENPNEGEQDQRDEQDQGQTPPGQGSPQGDPPQEDEQSQQGADGRPGRTDSLAQRTREAAEAAERLAEQMENAAESQGRQTSPGADAMREASQRLRDAAQQRSESQSADREGRPDEASRRREESARQTRDAERIVRQLLEEAKQQQQDQQEARGEGDEQRQQDQQASEGQQEGQEGQQPARQQGEQQESSGFDRENAQQTSVDRLLDRERRVREALERARRPMTAPRVPVERDW